MIDGLGYLLARNSIADHLIGSPIDLVENQRDEFANNEIWRIFMEPARQALYRDYEGLARNATALFRSSVAHRFGEDRVQALIRALLAGSPLFQRLWSEGETMLAQSAQLGMRHPDFGEIEVHSVRFPHLGVNDAMVIFLVPADARTRLVFLQWAPDKSGA